jgi:hypothetical protein
MKFSGQKPAGRCDRSTDILLTSCICQPFAAYCSVTDDQIVAIQCSENSFDV